MTLYKCISKYEFIKDQSINQLTIITKNFLCCQKVICNIFLENAYFDTYYEGDEENSGSRQIMLINTFKNSSEIDLDNNNSNLLNVPVKFYYILTAIGINDIQENILKLKNFLPNNNYKNNIEIEIDKYKNKYKYKEKPIINHFSFNPINFFPKRMKISELFYSFRFQNENFQRIDIIYSKNFDKIFIGVVKNDTTYITLDYILFYYI